MKYICRYIFYRVLYFDEINVSLSYIKILLNDIECNILGFN